MSKLWFALFVALFVSTVFCASPYMTRQDTVEGVTVAVTPGWQNEESPLLQFAVVFHSSGRPLHDDLLQAAFLVAGGRRLQPLSWEGEGPTSAHHRAGILNFLAPAFVPEDIEFHLQRPDEAAARIFRWDLSGRFALATPAQH